VKETATQRKEEIRV